MGSTLRDQKPGRIVWGDFSSCPFLNPLAWSGWWHNLVEPLKYPHDNLAAVGILNAVLCAPPWAKQEHYGRLLARLGYLGYRLDPVLPAAERNVYLLPYDWQ